jgi:hypothetical protein
MSKRSRLVTNITVKLPLLALSLAVTCLTSFAELPPSYYKKLQQEAPESLTIKVLAVRLIETAEPKGKKIAVTVQAQAQKVTRSKSGIKAGAKIHISYVHYKDELPTAGASEVPILEKDQVYSAYLTKRENGFAPAAGGHSFSEFKRD